jgi:hypothetical protein
MQSKFDNKIKAVTRQVVLKQYLKFAKPIFKKNEDLTAYTLPADMWTLEQQMVDHALYYTKTKSELNLTCFECDSDTYKYNTDSRYFMLNGSELHNRLNFEYKFDFMHRNLHAKKNFFMWADFCGCPTQERLDMVLNEKNLVTNSLIFVTFACRWRNCYTIPQTIVDMRDDLFANDLNPNGSSSHHASNAIESYMHPLMKPFGFRPIVNLEYIANQGGGATSMCVLGFSNSPTFNRTKIFRKTLNWFKGAVSSEVREVQNYLDIQACLNH